MASNKQSSNHLHISIQKNNGTLKEKKKKLNQQKNLKKELLMWIKETKINNNNFHFHSMDRIKADISVIK